ncbi:hypothetical protein [Clostridium sp. UBA6640]|uniref:hypothetical protein n=1 Tax=Clostridium sp. UBA6640 TaxID=1946370 RepID=UPI0025C47B7C|nr:hypothetical protein [Clostridium sp. UBA6640]
MKGFMKDYLQLICGIFACLIWIRYCIYKYKENKDIKYIIVIGIPICVVIGLIPAIRQNNELRNLMVALVAVDFIILFILYFVKGFNKHFKEAYKIYKDKKEK